MSCLSPEQIEACASGRLSGGLDEPDLALHLKECMACAELVEECHLNLKLQQDIEGAFSGNHPAPLVSAIGDPLWHERTRHFIARPGVNEGPLSAASIPGYEIIREIHRGGQGVVYEALQHSTQRRVAVKVMLEGSFAGERSRWRFDREVRLVAQLRHPNIVALHESGVTDGCHYFAMDYVCGQPLDTYVRLAGLGVRDIITLFVGVCDGVSHAHRHGIIHRDLKPGNILVGADGDPQILDFGLAKALVEDGEGPRGHSGQTLTTMPGHAFGTLRYMSPEQTRGELDNIDTRTDVYSLGVILYELLTGTAPYPTGGDLMVAFGNIREVDPPRPSKVRPEIPSDLDAVLLKAMDKEAGRRYSSAEELKQELVAWLEDRPVSARSQSSFYVLRKLAVRHSFESVVLLTLIVSVGAFGALALQGALYGRRMEQQRNVADDAFVALSENQELAGANRSGIEQDMAMGWFLLAWHEKDADRARRMRDRMPPGTPARAAMSLLIGEGYGLDELRAEAGEPLSALALYAIGEYHLAFMNRREARTALEECVRVAASESGNWWIEVARSRLAKLDTESASKPADVSGE